MNHILDPVEVRVLGCLVEKDLATPEYYPLTINALINACNQKSNRDPVVRLAETDVVQALDSLRSKQLAHQSAEGVRATKYCHNLENQLRLEPEELALVAELLLRGPQTVGELRSRAERMYPMEDLLTVEQNLQNLMAREDPLVVRLPRQPGRKEHRFAHLLSGTPDLAMGDDVQGEIQQIQSASDNDRLTRLEDEIATLRTEIGDLRSQLEEFRAQFE